MALTFDGSTDYVSLSANLTGIASSKLATLSFWFKSSTDPGDLFTAVNSGGNRFSVKLESSTGLLVVTARNSSNTTLYLAKTATDYTDGDWHHVLISLSLGSTLANIYVDRTSDEVITTGPTDGTIDWAGVTEWVIGGDTGGTSLFTGDLDDVVFFYNYYLDATDADTLAKVVSSDGRTHPSRNDIYWKNQGPDQGPKQVGYGPDGKDISQLTAPILMIGKNFQINRGSGQDFTINGSPAFSRGPLIYRQDALRPGGAERWFDSEQSGFSYPRSETVIERREGIPSFGKRIGQDEVDEQTRQERPGLSFSQIIMGTPGLEDDSDEDRR